MDIADWNGGAFRRRLDSADLFKEKAIFLGFSQVKTPNSKSNALLRRVTSPDQYFARKASFS